MDAFKSIVAMTLEDKGFVVSVAVKFPLRRRTRRPAHEEVQQPLRAVDLVGARHDRLVLATVRPYLGSRGAVAKEVMGVARQSASNAGYALLNDPEVRDTILASASDRYGYPTGLVEFRLYAGKFASPARGGHERAIRAWCAEQRIGYGPIAVHDVGDVAQAARRLAQSRPHRDNPTLVTIQVLEAAGLLIPGTAADLAPLDGSPTPPPPSSPPD